MEKLTHRSQLVVTTSILAEQLGADENSLTVNFNRNKSRYTEGVHYYLLKGNELNLYLTNCNMQISTKTRQLYLWTEKGAFNHVKSLGTEEAWDAFNKLVDTYFRMRSVSLTPAEQLLHQAQVLVDHERKIDALEHSVEEINAKLITRPEGYTVAGYASLKRLLASRELCLQLGKAASKFCRENNISIGKTKDEKFGHVNVYPVSVLEAVFSVSLITK